MLTIKNILISNENLDLLSVRLYHAVITRLAQTPVDRSIRQISVRHESSLRGIFEQNLIAFNNAFNNAFNFITRTNYDTPLFRKIGFSKD